MFIKTRNDPILINLLLAGTPIYTNESSTKMEDTIQNKMNKKLIIDLEENHREEIPVSIDSSINTSIDQSLFYDKIVDTWIDLCFYVQDEKLPWLDKSEAFRNFVKLCGYEK